jgi:CSLREA domain-containing protein
MKAYGWKLVARIGLILTLWVCGWPVMSVRAASTWMVTKSDDSNDGTCNAADCSLREAIAVAVDGDVISFNGNYTIYLNSQLDLNKSLTIDSSGHTIIISGDSGNNGSANVRAFNIAEGKVVTINHISVVNGYVQVNQFNTLA